jgi:hypothetical protein
MLGGYFLARSRASQADYGDFVLFLQPILIFCEKLLHVLRPAPEHPAPANR